MEIGFTASEQAGTGALVVPVYADRRLGAAAAQIDAATGGAVRRAMEASRFTGKKDQTLTLLAPAGVEAGRILLYGYGNPIPRTVNDLVQDETIGGKIVTQLLMSGVEDVQVVLETPPVGDETEEETGKEEGEEKSGEDETGGAMGAASPTPPDGTPPDGTGVEADIAARAVRLALGARLRAYRFDRYRAKLKAEGKPGLVRFVVRLPEAALAAAEGLWPAQQAVADGVFLARDLIAEPANILYPESFVERVQADLAPLGVKVTVLDEHDIQSLRMGALYGVAQGSIRPPRVLILRWNGLEGEGEGESQEAAAAGEGLEAPGPVALIGKGVTFDSGGLSLKPAGAMEEMKNDMGGAAVVVGVMRALAARKAKVDVVALAGLVENMPSANAQKPGDVVTTLSGQTVEVLNTDAEGRLVLADVLYYAEETYKPQVMIDLATLTGAMIIALGHEMAGFFTEDDTLAEAMETAGRDSGDPVWRLPLAKAYDKLLDCDIADMKNIGGRPAGSITAAQFLKRFVGKVPWAHIDIAGVTWADKGRDTVPKGARGFGVRLLERLIADRYEQQG